jgi:hypothetical protein
VNGTKPTKVFHTYSISYINHAMMLIIPSSANLGASSVMGSLHKVNTSKENVLDRFKHGQTQAYFDDFKTSCQPSCVGKSHLLAITEISILNVGIP